MIVKTNYKARLTLGLLIAFCCMGMATGELVELTDYLNAHLTSNVRKNAPNVAYALAPKTVGKILEKRTLRRKNYALQLEIHNGNHAGQKIWVYYDRTQPRLKLYHGIQETAEPEKATIARTTQSIDGIYVPEKDEPTLNPQMHEIQQLATQAIGFNSQARHVASVESGCSDNSAEDLPLNDTTENYADAFCQDPYKAVCTRNMDATSYLRGRKINAVQDQAKKEALLDIATRVLKLKDPAKFTEYDFLDIAPQSLQDRAYTAYNKSYVKSIEAQVSQQEQIVRIHFDEIKSMLKKVIMDQTTIPQDFQQKMLAKVDSVQFASVGDTIMRGKEDLYKAFIDECGPRLGLENALAQTEDNKRTTVVFCPGAFVGSTFDEAATSPDFLITSMVQIIGHEISHAVDNTQISGLYDHFFQCVQDNDSALFTTPKKSRSYLPEMIADYWGNEVLAKRLATIPDRALRGKALVAALEGLCNSQDGGGPDYHPGAQLRIATMARFNPELQKVLGCPARPSAATRVSCTLKLAP